jgi:hypothetical protein
MTVTRVFRAWKEDWEKVHFISAGDKKFATRFSAKYENLMWYDPDSKKTMHLATGDCAVLIKLDKNSERKREKEKGGHMFCWECMMMFMMRSRGALTMIQIVMPSMR